VGCHGRPGRGQRSLCDQQQEPRLGAGRRQWVHDSHGGPPRSAPAGGGSGILAGESLVPGHGVPLRQLVSTQDCSQRIRSWTEALAHGPEIPCFHSEFHWPTGFHSSASASSGRVQRNPREQRRHCASKQQREGHQDHDRPQRVPAVKRHAPGVAERAQERVGQFDHDRDRHDWGTPPRAPIPTAWVRPIATCQRTPCDATGARGERRDHPRGSAPPPKKSEERDEQPTNSATKRRGVFIDHGQRLRLARNHAGCRLNRRPCPRPTTRQRADKATGKATSRLD